MHSRNASLVGRERLNPHAKPFVFGGSALASAFAGAKEASVASASPRSSANTFTPRHTNDLSLGMLICKHPESLIR